MLKKIFLSTFQETEKEKNLYLTDSTSFDVKTLVICILTAFSLSVIYYWGNYSFVRNLLVENRLLGILTQASVEQALEWAEEFSAVAIHPHFSLLTTENVALTRQKGYQIFTWTVNEFEDIERVKSFGVNGIITDFSDRI